MTDHTGDVIVITHDPIDFGQGAHTVTVFSDATYHIDDKEYLHIRSSIEGRGNLAAFARGQYRSVVGGAAVRVTPVTLETIGDINATQIAVQP